MKTDLNERVGFSRRERYLRVVIEIFALPVPFCFYVLVLPQFGVDIGGIRPSAVVLFAAIYAGVAFYHCLNLEFFGIVYEIDADGVSLIAPSGFRQHGVWDKLIDVKRAIGRDVFYLVFDDGNTILLPKKGIPFKKVVTAFAKYTDNPNIVALKEKVI